MSVTVIMLKCLFVCFFENWLTIPWSLQMTGAKYIHWYRGLGKHTVGTFSVPSSGLDHLLLLCLEGSKIHRKGKTEMTNHDSEMSPHSF